MNNDESSTRIGKRSLISLEVLILAVMVAVSMVSTTLMQNNKISNNTDSIAEMAEEIDGVKIELIKINATLTGIAKGLEISNAVEEYKMRNRWGSDSMEAHDNAWLKILQEYHPELRHDDVPDVNAIRDKFGYE